MATETGVLYTSDDLEKDVAPPSDADAVTGAAGAEEPTRRAGFSAAEEARAHSSPSRVDVAADRDDAVLHDAVTLERGASATSAPWCRSPSGSVCFEVALDARADGGLPSGGFAPGPDGRPRVAAVSETGAAFGEVNVGDVVLETSEVVMVETEINDNASDPASASSGSSNDGAGATRKTAASTIAWRRCAPTFPSRSRRAMTSTRARNTRLC